MDAGSMITAGGKVVKNAAGLLLHQAMVGSCGRFGVLAEVTFKVFPRAKAQATVKVSTSDLADALERMDAVRRARFELEAVDVDAPSTLLLRMGGAVEALPARLAALRTAVAVPGELLEGTADEAEWRRAREFSWASSDVPLVRVPLTTPRVAALDSVSHVMAPRGATRSQGTSRSCRGRSHWTGFPMRCRRWG